jgi:hypothetical protein
LAYLPSQACHGQPFRNKDSTSIHRQFIAKPRLSAALFRNAKHFNTNKKIISINKRNICIDCERERRYFHGRPLRAHAADHKSAEDIAKPDGRSGQGKRARPLWRGVTIGLSRGASHAAARNQTV